MGQKVEKVVRRNTKLKAKESAKVINSSSQVGVCSSLCQCYASTMSDPTTLISKLQSSFENAHHTGDLYFFPSTVSTHSDSGIEVIDIIKPELEHIQG